MRLVLVVACALFLAWLAAVHILFFLTLDKELIDAWLSLITRNQKIVSLMWTLSAHFVIGPLWLLASVWLLYSIVHRPIVFGFLAGLFVALWANVGFLTIPYLGAYTSIPAGLLAWSLTGGASAGPWFYTPIVICNFVFWIATGTLICALWMRRRRMTNALGQ